MRCNLCPVPGEESEGAAVNNTILIGDVIEKLKEIPDQHINTCVTSPPYWGLRDYGTAEWKGGDSDCDHIKGTLQSQKSTLHPGSNNKNDKRTTTGMPYSDICGKCGAIRQDNQIGLEKKPELYVDKMVKVFREVRRVLRDDGTLWLNLGDSYAANQGDGFDTNKDGGERKRLSASPKVKSGLPPKNLVGIPWRVAFALQADGWYLRQDIIWHKPNPMPESVKDRCTKAHEYIFLLSKSQKYYYDYEAIKEPAISGDRQQPNPDDKTISPNGETPWLNNKYAKGASGYGVSESGRNKRSVWTVSTKPFPGSHFATFPPDLIEPCILAGSPRDGIVLDCFFGTGTTGKVSLKNGRYYIGIELKPEYAEMAENRIKYGIVDPEEIEAEKKQGVLF